MNDDTPPPAPLRADALTVTDLTNRVRSLSADRPPLPAIAELITLAGLYGAAHRAWGRVQVARAPARASPPRSGDA